MLEIVLPALPKFAAKRFDKATSSLALPTSHIISASEA
jgi:hypothetical protein